MTSKTVCISDAKFWQNAQKVRNFGRKSVHLENLRAHWKKRAQKNFVYFFRNNLYFRKWNQNLENTKFKSKIKKKMAPKWLMKNFHHSKIFLKNKRCALSSTQKAQSAQLQARKNARCALVHFLGVQGPPKILRVHFFEVSWLVRTSVRQRQKFPDWILSPVR